MEDEQTSQNLISMLNDLDDQFKIGNEVMQQITDYFKN